MATYRKFAMGEVVYTCGTESNTDYTTAYKVVGWQGTGSTDVYQLQDIENPQHMILATGEHVYNPNSVAKATNRQVQWQDAERRKYCKALFKARISAMSTEDATRFGEAESLLCVNLTDQLFDAMDNG